VLALALPARAADLDKYVPADAQQVAVINVKQILSSALVKKHALPEIEKLIQNNKEAKTLQLLTGIDPLKDISSVVVASSGTSPDKVVGIVRGTFDTDKIQKFVEILAADKKDEWKITKLGARPLYEHSAGGKSAFMTFIDGTTAI